MDSTDLLFVVLTPAAPLALIWFFVWLTARDKRNAERTAAQTAGAVPAGRDALWSLLQEDKEHGPFGFTQLVRFKDAGILTAGSRLKAAGSGEIVEARHVPGLFPGRTVEFVEEPVEFQTFGGQRDPLLSGKGTVRIAQGMLIVIGRRRRLFALGKKEERIPLDRVYDVMTEGALLTFRVEGQAEKRPRLLKMTTTAAVEALAGCLPKRLSVSTAQVKADKAAFARFLQETGTPYVSMAIVVANLAVFLIVGLKGGGWTTGNPAVLIDLGGNIAPATAQGQWWRLLTATFLHSGFMHVGFNMWALWDAGRVAERLFGRLRYLSIYLAAGLLGSIASINWQQEMVSVGASGAVFGIYGALIAALVLRKDLLPLTIAVQLRNSATVLIIYSLANGFSHAGIDNSAHLGGLMAGAMLGAGFVAPRPGLWASVAVAASLFGIGVVRAVDVVEPFKDELAFRAFVASFAAEDKRLNAALQQLTRGGKSQAPKDLAARLDHEVIAGWGTLETRIKRIERIAPRNRRIRDSLAEFVETKRDSLETLRDGIDRNDGLLILASILKSRLANEQMAEATRILSEEMGKTTKPPDSAAANR